MSEMVYSDALADALYDRMKSDRSVLACGTSFLMGPGMRTDVVNKMRDENADRIIDPPIAESAIATLGIGAALAGAKPFIHFGRASFAYEALSQICTEAANVHYMSNGQQTCPVVMHMYHGLLPVESAQHCHSPQAFFWNTPGLEIVLPSTPQDVYSLMQSAFESPNPTIVLGHARLMAVKGAVNKKQHIPLGKAEVRRAGSDITIVATSWTVHTVLEAADALAKTGISVEVIDPRTLVPFDKETVLESVSKTGRLIIVDETSLSCGVASEISAIVAEAAFSSLKAPICRISRPDVPVIFSNELQDLFAPSVQTIIDRAAALIK